MINVLYQNVVEWPNKLAIFNCILSIVLIENQIESLIIILAIIQPIITLIDFFTKCYI